MKILTSLAKHAMRIALSTVITATTALTVSAQVTFEREYDMPNYSSIPACPGRYYELARAVAQQDVTRDYFLAGGYMETPCNVAQGAIVKLNYKGEVQWTKQIPNGYYTDIKCVYSATGQNGLVAAGSHADNSGTFNKFELVRFDNTYSMSAHKVFANSAVCNEVNTTVQHTTGLSGFIAIGTALSGSNKHIILVNTDDNLNVAYQKEFFLGGNLEGMAVTQTYDKGFIMTGCLSNSLLWVAKVDYKLDIVWEYKYPVLSGTLDIIGKDVIEATNGVNYGYYIVGNTIGSGSDPYAIQLDANGIYVRSCTLSIAGTELVSGFVPSNLSNLAISGTTNGNPFLIDLSNTFNITYFSKKFTQSTVASRPIRTDDLGYMLVGKSNGVHNMFSIKTLSNGSTECHDINLPCTVTSVNQYQLTTSVSDNTMVPPSSHTESGNVVIYNATAHCVNFCRGVGVTYSTVTDEVCYNEMKTLSSNCPPGTNNTIWFLGTTMPSTNSTIYVTLTSNTTYVAKCYNAEGCVIKEETHNVNVPAAPSVITHSVTTCYGENVFIPTPCNPDPVIWSNGAVGNLSIQSFGNQTITAKCMGVNNCPVTIHEYNFDVQPPVITHVDVNLCMTGTVILDNHNTSGDPCTWEYNGSPVSGSTPLSYTSPGTYIYTGTVTAPNGCISYISLSVHVQVCAGDGKGIVSQSNKGKSYNNIEIYPNPGSSIVKIKVDIQNDETYDLQVMDILGKAILNKTKVAESELSLDISELPAGVYQVEVLVNGELIRKKLVKQ